MKQCLAIKGVKIVCHSNGIRSSLSFQFTHKNGVPESLQNESQLSLLDQTHCHSQQSLQLKFSASNSDSLMNNEIFVGAAQSCDGYARSHWICRHSCRRHGIEQCPEFQTLCMLVFSLHPCSAVKQGCGLRDYPRPPPRLTKIKLED